MLSRVLSLKSTPETMYVFAFDWNESVMKRKRNEFTDERNTFRMLALAVPSLILRPLSTEATQITPPLHKKRRQSPFANGEQRGMQT